MVNQYPILDLPSIITHACLNATGSKNLISGFTSADIFPFNLIIIGEAFVADWPEPGKTNDTSENVKHKLKYKGIRPRAFTAKEADNICPRKLKAFSPEILRSFPQAEPRLT